ncbi:MAG: metal-binding protein ZinT [Spirochaetaceae bacterium]|jgi:Zn/Cd-binding protein ZinT|nr:metal-binding protein ZinT [Spirochaetaceae bacterium]
MKGYVRVLAIGLLLPFMVLGCATAKGAGEPELAQWNGTYNSLASYLDEPSFAGIFADKDAAKADLGEYLATDFASMKIEGDTLTLYTERDAKGAAATIHYTFKRIIEPGRGVWYAFESDRSDHYRCLIATVPGQDDPGGALHFHFRYGARDFDALATAAKLPTAVQADTPDDNVQESLEEFFDRFASLQRWEGTYNSLASYLDEPSFAGIFAGKDEAKANLAEYLVTDFTSMKIEGDTLILYTERDAKGAATAIDYRLTRIIEPGRGIWYAFESDRSDHYRCLIATVPGQDDPGGALHFHFRYGARDFDALATAANLPTAVQADTPDDNVQEILEEFFDRFASE